MKIYPPQFTAIQALTKQLRDRLIPAYISTIGLPSYAQIRPQNMLSVAPVRFVVALGLTASALLAQSPMPKPTATVPSLPADAAASTPLPPPTPSQQPPKHAQVAYADGVLSISADNASLNQILRQIAHETGLKITGGVTDERVFGQYGPAPAPQILAKLLDGTGSNMLFVPGDGDGPAELILTPRQGGPTPPSPNAPAFDDRQELRSSTEPEPEPASTPPSPAPHNQNEPTSAAPGATPTSAAQPDSPNGVKTPQEIYEQLQRMRQQQQPTAPQ
jgi:hypothetical protein